jgi:predicted nucleic acid-binding protein
MNFMNAIDTNIWIYSHDTRDLSKQLVAQNLIGVLRPLALPWQVGCEFIAASRKLASIGFTEAQAWAALTHMQAMSNVVLLPTPRLWQAAQPLQSKHMLSFWDALMVGACIQGGVQVLYTEDLGTLSTVNGLTIVNPFLVGGPTQGSQFHPSP